jgi:hypothetical protein
MKDAHMPMNDGLSQARDWKKLYSAALREGDRSRMPLLIDDAERAIVTRARQLFASPDDNLREQHALDSAMDALHILKRCLATRAKTARAA